MLEYSNYDWHYGWGQVQEYKGISDVRLISLGQINILCGKNNSGKTSILEALQINSSRGVGKKVVVDESLQELFRVEALRFNDPQPQISVDWFNSYLAGLAREETVWFSDDSAQLEEIFRDKLMSYTPLARFGNRNMFNFGHIVRNFFGDIVAQFKPVLIPPKRALETSSNIELNKKIAPTGEGLLNRLFFLKNQSPVSNEFKTYSGIQGAFYEITGHRFNITPNQNNRIGLFYQRNDGTWISADACGLGLSDVLVLITLTLDFDYTFLMIEEPESHLHPDMQRKLLYFFKQCSNKQFLISTHSNIFLDNALIDRVFFCTFRASVEVNDATRRASILDDLGYSITDNLVSDLIILVEGPKDIPVIEEYLLKMGIYQKYDIKLWPLGGDIMDQVDLSVFAQGYHIVGLVDDDPGSAAIRKRFIANCKNQGIEVVKLKRYAIENYFSLRALKVVFGSQITDDIADIEPDKRLSDQIGLNVKNNNRKLAQEMSIDEIKGTDLHKFFVKIEGIVRSES